MNTQTIIQNITEGLQKYSYVVKENDILTIVLAGVQIKKAEIVLHVALTGSGGKATIAGIFIGKKSSDIRLHTTQIHQAPETTSNLLVKSVLSDGSSFNFNGSIRVEKIAQKTDAYQRNENLLVGDGAHAISNPTLEILANDVKCTHGSTTGPINAEELWYLESRGIPQIAAKKLIVEGYVSGAINLVEDPLIRDRLWQKIRSAI